MSGHRIHTQQPGKSAPALLYSLPTLSVYTSRRNTHIDPSDDDFPTAYRYSETWSLGAHRRGQCEWSTNLCDALAHVLWIGGAPGAGKTSIADLLAAKYTVQVYHFDRHEPAHFARAAADQHPALFAAHPVRMTPDERSVQRPVAMMVQETVQSWSERFSMARAARVETHFAPLLPAQG
jgi:hypothetical protein